MMTRLARERHRSALGWTLIAIGAWIGSEILVGFAGGIIEGIGVTFWGWPSRSSGLSLLIYIIALVAALLSVTLVSRILAGKPIDEELSVPPPPPAFGTSDRNDRS